MSLSASVPYLTLEFSTCDLCDAHAAALGADLRVLPAGFRNFGQQHIFCGPVDTLQCWEDNALVKSAVQSAGWVDTPQGRVRKVLVVDAGGSLRRAMLGGNLGAAAARNDWAGVVIDGCVRDSAELAQQAVGIRALGTVPLATEKRGAGVAQRAVQMQGVWVYPGDWLFADADGMVLLAPALAQTLWQRSQ